MNLRRYSQTRLSNRLVVVKALRGLLGQTEFDELLAERDTLNFPKTWELIRKQLYETLVEDEIFTRVRCGTSGRKNWQKVR